MSSTQRLVEGLSLFNTEHGSTAKGFVSVAALAPVIDSVLVSGPWRVLLLYDLSKRSNTESLGKFYLEVKLQLRQLSPNQKV